MTTPEALTAIADRVEREEPIAGGPLDADIAEAVLGSDVYPYPPYTTSLDSAVTLVPKGWRWAAVYEHPQGAFSANLDKPNFCIARGYARTEVAARVIAALRARAADMQARFAPHPSPSGN